MSGFEGIDDARDARTVFEVDIVLDTEYESVLTFSLLDCKQVKEIDASLWIEYEVSVKVAVCTAEYEFVIESELIFTNMVVRKTLFASLGKKLELDIDTSVLEVIRLDDEAFKSNEFERKGVLIDSTALTELLKLLGP